jgi:hypothetical protein
VKSLQRTERRRHRPHYCGMGADGAGKNTRARQFAIISRFLEQ